MSVFVGLVPNTTLRMIHQMTAGFHFKRIGTWWPFKALLPHPLNNTQVSTKKSSIHHILFVLC